jgi:hypothetical protein
MSTTPKAGMAERNIHAAFELAKQIVDDPNILDSIPDGAAIVFIPRDDPEAAESNLQLGLTVLQRGEDVYFRHVDTLDIPKEILD